MLPRDECMGEFICMTKVLGIENSWGGVVTWIMGNG